MRLLSDLEQAGMVIVCTYPPSARVLIRQGVTAYDLLTCLVR
jgi:hypothetical protein